jgi:hypothetical protein
MSTIKRTIACFIILTSTIILSSSNTHFETQKEKNYFPKVLKKVRFGMNASQVESLLTDFEKSETASFRTIYTSNLSDKSIETIVFYFDNDADQPLYEIIIDYKTEELRDKDAKKLLGAPNHKQKEWKLKSGKDYPIHAWTFQKKLIIVAVLPGTEWEGEDL